MTIHPAPKPSPSVKSPKQPIPRTGKRKRERKPTWLLPVSTTSQAAKDREKFAREYGSPERVEWVQHRQCAGCGYCGPVLRENHHIKTGGKGRKADARFIIALCVSRISWIGNERIEGCHERLHRIGRQSFERLTNCHLETAAAKTELAWQAHEHSAA